MPPKTIGKVTDPAQYLAPLCEILATPWPRNRTVNIVCHGHSVPAGYFRTPTVDTFNAYPHLLHRAVKERFPLGIVNVIVTAIGGEDSEKGAARFERDVLPHVPDLILIDYALNDRRLGLERARRAWVTMLEKARSVNCRVILLTPTGDLSAGLDRKDDPLNQHARQIRALASEYQVGLQVGLADSLAAFQRYLQGGGKLEALMAQVNHPNRSGHDLVVGELLNWFPTPHR